MFRRAAGSLVARRFSPRATPRTAPARSLQPSRDHPPHRKDTGSDESAAGKVTGAGKEVTDSKVRFKKPDMNERFERWIIKNNKTYRDEEEKAMRFQLFKTTVEWIESQPLSVQEGYFPEISYFADITEEESQCMLAYPHRYDTDRTEYNETVKAVLAKQEKGGQA